MQVRPISICTACILACFCSPQHAWAGAPGRVKIGNGSGHLRYVDAPSTLKLQPGDTLYINPGSYSGLSLGNLSGTAASPITVTCDPQAVFTTAVPQPNDFPNIAHVRFVYFNTLYRSRKAVGSKDPYCATLVDIYGPDVTIKHNLVVEPEADAPFDAAHNYVYHLGAGPQAGLTVDNNLVFGTWAEAGLVDTKTFMPSKNSPARRAASGRIGYITKDYFNNDRYEGGAADVGAVEGRSTAE